MKTVYLSPFHNVKHTSNGRVTTDMFVRFCIELNDALSIGLDLFHPKNPDGESFNHATSHDQYFTRHQGICFNFVSWLHFKEFGNQGVFVAGEHAYGDNENRLDLSDLHDEAKPILRLFFKEWINHDTFIFDGCTQRAAAHGTTVYPFADQMVHSHLCDIGKVLEERERTTFLIAVGDWSILTKPDGAVTAEDFREFLVDWIAFAEKFAGVKTADRRRHPFVGLGLCGSFVHFMNSKHPTQTSGAHASFTGAAGEFIRNIFRSEDLDVAYPFGFEEYITEAKEGALHTNETRIAWAKAHL